ncbi:hypothetical protein C8R44DRAFT_798249, partial [Mycena epipterygia]
MFINSHAVRHIQPTPTVPLDVPLQHRRIRTHSCSGFISPSRGLCSLLGPQFQRNTHRLSPPYIDLGSAHANRAPLDCGRRALRADRRAESVPARPPPSLLAQILRPAPPQSLAFPRRIRVGGLRSGVAYPYPPERRPRRRSHFAAGPPSGKPPTPGHSGLCNTLLPYLLDPPRSPYLKKLSTTCAGTVTNLEMELGVSFPFFISR